MMTRTLSILTALTLALTLVACGGEAPEDEYRDAVPKYSELVVEVPGTQAVSENGKLTQALIGQRAGLYQMTYETSRGGNAAIWVGLKMIEQIVQYPPSAVDPAAGTALWGPHTDALGPLTWQLVVKKEAKPGHYSYVLQARKRNDTGPFSDILGGSSRRLFGGLIGVYGASATTLNQLDPITHPEVGELRAVYDTTFGKRHVKLALAGFSDDGGTPVSLAYHYRVGPRGAGVFVFGARGDVNENGTANELVEMITAWDVTGQGRGDARVSEGDIPAGQKVHITECWDANFGRTFYADSAGWNPTEGDPTQCLYGQPAEEPAEPDPNAEPDPSDGENLQ